MSATQKAENQRRGAINKAMGKMFEQRLDGAFAYYEQHGLAFVEKTPEPIRAYKDLKDGRFLAVFTAKAQPDYKGVIKGGRAVMIEAKFTLSDRFTQDRVTPGQAEYMTKNEALGARCYVIVGFVAGGVYRIPWAVWKDMKGHFGRKYVRESDLQQYRVLTAKNGALLVLH